MESADEELELNLLGDDERHQAAFGLEEAGEMSYGDEVDSTRPVSAKDKRGMVLLCVLCQFFLAFCGFDS